MVLHRASPVHKSVIIIIDRFDRDWVELVSKSMKNANYRVILLHNYNRVSSLAIRHKAELIVLGCPQVGDEEFTLIGQLFQKELPFIVYGLDMDLDTMREVFSHGALFAGEKDFAPGQIIARIEQVLHRLDERKHKLFLPVASE